MKKEQLLLMMMAIFFSIGLKAQSTYTMDDKWYNIYGYMHFMHDDQGLQTCEEPKQVYSQLQKQSYEQKALQLLHFNFPLDSLSDSHLAAYAEYGNIHKDDGSITGVSLFMPNTKLLTDDCRVTINFPAQQLFECEQYYWSLPQYQLYEYNQYKKVNSISIYHEGEPVVSDLLPGGSFEVDYFDIYRKNLSIQVQYDNGQTIDYVFRMDASKYDWGICGPPPVGDPVNPDDWPPGDGPEDEDDGNDVLCCPGPPSPPDPPEFDEDCLYQPDEVWEVVAEIEYKDDHPYQYTGIFSPDYHAYGSPANQAVYEGDPGGPMDKRYRGVIEASVYLKPGRTKVENPIIITDGIDFTSSRSSSTNLQIMGGNAMLQKFFDGGYDLIMVDFKGGADFIQKNSFALIELIRRLHHDEGVEEIPAIIGPSMGGQIVRYALLYWEQNLLGTYGDYNIETFLSADSPWKGANASPAIQCASRLFANIEPKLLRIDQMANAPAARQLLLHQVHGLDEAFGTYDGIQHPFKTTFDAELLAMGDFPKDTKIIAIADGGNGGDVDYEAFYDFPNSGESILMYSKEIYSLNVVSSMNDLAVGKKLIDFEVYSSAGQLNDFLEAVVLDSRGLREIHTINVTVQGLDHSPGSPFRLRETLEYLGVSGVQLENTFAFVPTFSALGISTNNANIDVEDPSNQSPYFDAFFVDNSDSGHNDFQQSGTLDFFFEEIGYQSGYDQNPCDFLEQSILNGDSPYQPNDPITYDLVYTYFDLDSAWDLTYSGSSEYCRKDLRLINEENIVVSPTKTFNILEDPCGFDPHWDFAKDELIIPANPPFENEISCQVKIELCFEHSMCPELDICQIVEINIDVNPTPSSLIPEIQLYDQLMDQNEISSKDKFEVYPNPSNGALTVGFNDGIKRIEVFDIIGRKVLSQNISEAYMSLELDPGTYLFRVHNFSNDAWHVEKVIVK